MICERTSRQWNAAVLFAIARSTRLRSMTNVFLANIAIADISVGIFCVLPNLSTFLQPDWVLGRTECDVQDYYIWNVSYIASIIILTVIAMEIYIVIMHPLRGNAAVVFFANARSTRLRSMTNVFLANLAIDDISVGIFCVLPNLSTFLQPNWVHGREKL
ncbi:trissin receptor-like [Mya arenaria]|uniref:trissin receptor-like n=1 Tax=Mya arenaria TaxID=6604 RepID=UPI0022E0B930|nr:trissin receptor-like [Mya arenaria]